jgi:hypothetical protein
MVKLRLFDGLEENGGFRRAEARLSAINGNSTSEVRFFTLDNVRVDHLKDLDLWMSREPEPPELVVVAWVHFSAARDIATHAKAWDERMRASLFVLLYSGGPEVSERQKGALELRPSVAGAWSIDPGFDVAVAMEEWTVLRERLLRSDGVDQVRALLERGIGVLNGTDQEDVQPRDLLLALQILLRSLGVLALRGRISSAEWWRRGLGWTPPSKLKAKLREALEDRDKNDLQGELDALVDAIAGNGDILTAAAAAAAAFAAAPPNAAKVAAHKDEKGASS